MKAMQIYREKFTLQTRWWPHTYDIYFMSKQSTCINNIRQKEKQLREKNNLLHSYGMPISGVYVCGCGKNET